MKYTVALLLALLYFLLFTRPAWASTVTVRYIISSSKSVKLSQVTEQPAYGASVTGGTAKPTPTQKPRKNTPPVTDIEGKIRAKFGKWADVAVAVAKCESGLRPNAIGDGHLTFWQDGVEYGYSVGPFQIRTLPGRPSADELLIPDFNIQYAYDLFLRSGFQPWTCYTSGGYLAHL